MFGIGAPLNKTGGLFRSLMTNRNEHMGDSNTPMSTKQRKGVSGRGEIVRDIYNNKVLRRVRSRRKDNDRRVALRKNSSASDSDSGVSPQRPSSQNITDPSQPGKLANLFTFIEHHPNLPHILSFYAQLALNIFLVLAIIYGIYTFWSTIRADVDKKAEEAELDVLASIAACAHEFRENGCAAERRVPALEAPCANWRRCMDRDAKGVGRARVSAHTFAEIFNSFIEPISIKAMVSRTRRPLTDRATPSLLSSLLLPQFRANYAPRPLTPPCRYSPSSSASPPSASPTSPSASSAQRLTRKPMLHLLHHLTPWHQRRTDGQVATSNTGDRHQTTGSKGREVLCVIAVGEV